MAKKILIIDDEKDVADIIKKKIQNAGYDVYVAYNGKEGLELTQQIHPDLILTDIVMPIMDGFAFYNELKSRPDIQHIPVIVSTAYGTTQDRLIEMGVKDFLQKPYNTQSLVGALSQFFTKTRAFKVLIVTKMFFLMKNIVADSKDIAQQLDIKVTNNQETLLHDALEFKPELIILDVDMFIKPTADEITAQLRAQESLKETRILLNRSMLGDEPALIKSSNQMVQQCLQNGASQYVGSLNRDSFLTIVSEYCHIKQNPTNESTKS